MIASARATWPEIAVNESAFLEHVLSPLEPSEDTAPTIDALHGSDLWLAFACGAGHREAIRALDRQLEAVVPQALARMRGAAPVEDVAQLLREKLLVARADARPKILDYSGRGPLGGWLRIAAMRTALSLVRRGDAAYMDPITQEVLFELPAAAPDPEMALLRERYSHELKRAFEAALAELPAEDRNVLRLSVVDKLSVSAIGLVFGVHRATAARLVARCTEHLQRRTRELLLERLDVNRSELQSILRHVNSQLDLSLQRLLAPGEAPPAAPRSPPKRRSRRKR